MDINMKSNRKIIIGASALSVIILIGVLFGFKASEKEKQIKPRPNIIYIMADDLGYGEVGFTGQKKILTPNIDQLAKEGIIFNNHYAGTSVTSSLPKSIDLPLTVQAESSRTCA